ncbi:Ac45/VOA1 transmembrane domain-containing protein [Sporobolomyces salmoneus]|uniref:Ac45/VOA1 transmembrane domain-containing protein n=1 Tax=Sporobolomyces salmoneus TaxID=183962 RepID=UPI00317CB269
MLRPTSTLALALSCAYTVTAFTGTYPIVAWSDQKLDSLSLLSTSSPSSSSSAPLQGSTSQQTFSDSEPPSDLCSLSSLLVVSVPGLHFSDIARLPLSSSSRAGISSALAHAESSTTQPYVREHTLSKPLKLVRRFERECGAVFESQHEKNLWSGGEAVKTIRIVQVDGLGEYELNTEGANEGRKQIMENADAAVSYHLANLPSPHAVILTALPASYSSPRRLNTKQPHLHLNNKQKRQMYEPSTEDISDLPEEEQEFIEEVLEEIKEEQAFDEMMNRVQSHDDETATSSSSSSSDIGVSEIITPEELISEEEEKAQQDEWDGEMLEVSPYSDYSSFQKDKKNGTSIFEPKEKSGLLHRYVFFTPALVFALLVTLMVLIPTVLIAVQALTSIETPHGLESKMTGTVGIDPSKA